MSHGWPPTAIAGSSKRELMKRSAPRTTKVCLTTAFRWRTSLIFELRLRVEEVRAGHDLALLWQFFRRLGFPNQFFSDSWVVGLWRGRPWRTRGLIGKMSFAVGSSRSWNGWV